MALHRSWVSFEGEVTWLQLLRISWLQIFRRSQQQQFDKSYVFHYRLQQQSLQGNCLNGAPERQERVL